MPQAQLQQLVTAVVDARDGSSARSAAVALWSAAKMVARLPQEQVRVRRTAAYPGAKGNLLECPA
jgi:hypothetical protein